MADNTMSSRQFYPFGCWVLFCLIFTFLIGNILATTPSNISPQSVTDNLIQSALTSLNDNSPTGHKYRGGSLVAAQKSLKSPFIVYKITLRLLPECSEGSTCEPEVCELEIKEDEFSRITIDDGSKRCMYDYPQSSESTNQLSPDSDTQDLETQTIIDNLEKQIVNESGKTDDMTHNVRDQDDKPFTVTNHQQPPYCPGCPYALNPEMAGIREAFGEPVLSSLDDYTRSIFKHNIATIVQVTRAVPPGGDYVVYELIMDIGQTNCFKSNQIPRANCLIQYDKPLITCRATFHERPWLVDSRQMVRNNCTESAHGRPTEDSMVNNDNSDNDQISETQQVDEVRSPTDTGSTDDQVALEQSIIDKLFEVRSARPKQNDETVDQRPEVTEEPFKETRISKKDIEDEKIEKKNKWSISKDPAEKIKVFDEFLNNFDMPPSDRSQRSQVSRQRRALKHENSNYILKLAQKAINYLDDIDKDDNKRVIVNVLKAQKFEDEIKGVIYHITVQSASTDCSESRENVKTCSRLGTEPLKICKIQVNTKEASNQSDDGLDKVIDIQCFDEREKRSKRTAVGAPSTISIDDPEVNEYVQQGLKKYTSQYQGTREPMITQVVEATSQVVAGTLYKIKVKIGESTCPKGQFSPTCLVADGSPIKDCVIEAWSRPWLTDPAEKLQITVKCNNERRKRGLKGQGYSQKMLKMYQNITLGRDLRDKEAFNAFQLSYDKTYASEEEKSYRFGVFQANMRRAEELQKQELGTATYGATIFADLTYDEFRQRHLGLRYDLRSENEIPMMKAEIPDIPDSELPTEFDWRHYNAVSPVKDQGGCGSCWAFSVTGNVEGQYAIKHGTLLSLSEQELVDCDKLDDGCNGGLQENAYRALEQLGGLELETDYPYDGQDEKCHFKKTKAVVNVVSAVNITSDETQMAKWLVKNGPMAIGINANAMQFYMGGISHPWSFLCNKGNLDHGVLIIGYGTHKYPIFKKTMPYWIVKNSWGTSWGEQGYYRVYRGDGTCGLNTDVTSAVVA